MQTFIVILSSLHLGDSPTFLMSVSLLPSNSLLPFFNIFVPETLLFLAFHQLRIAWLRLQPPEAQISALTSYPLKCGVWVFKKDMVPQVLLVSSLFSPPPRCGFFSIPLPYTCVHSFVLLFSSLCIGIFCLGLTSFLRSFSTFFSGGC